MKTSRGKKLRWGFIVGLLLWTTVSLSAGVLSVPVVTQEQNQWCWAATSNAILTYYGNTLSQCQIAEFTRTQANWYDFGSANCCVNPNVGCNYWNYLYGFPGSIAEILNHWSVPNTSSDAALTKATVKTLIDDFRPFIIRWGWTEGGGHFVVGHGLENDNLYYMDPWYGEGAKVAIYDWVLSDGNHTWTHSVTPNSRPAVLLPGIGLSKKAFNFGAVRNGTPTTAETAVISNTGSGTLNWKATPSTNWISVSPGTGTGAGVLTIGISRTDMAAGQYSGTIAITATGATNTPQTITINLTVKAAGSDSPPFGNFATPNTGVTVASSVPVTGWALDDIGMKSVKIYRGTNTTNRIYIGDAVFVEGARPDVKNAYPTYPQNSKAGWGYMLLTNFLPNSGNGTFTLLAYAKDTGDHEVLLGSKTITCDNLHAVKPFGAIDTPSQGGTASGAAFVNFGWALTPQPNSIATNGSTIWVYVDGAALGHPTYNNYRKDIATFFAGYANSNAAIGYYYLNTTGYTDGVHTIAWSVADTGGNSDGIGSRYFAIQNAGGGSSAENAADSFQNTGMRSADEISAIPENGRTPVFVKRGWKNDVPAETVYPEADGSIRITIPEVSRLAVSLNKENTGKTEAAIAEHGRRIPNQTGSAGAGFEAYELVGDDLLPLPIGASFDSREGVFYWQPGPGFLGEYHFVVVDSKTATKRTIKITIGDRS